MKVLDVAQRSPEWVAARLGRLTSTGAADILSFRKDGEGKAGRRHLKTRLVLERLTGRSHESGYVSAAMQAGIDREPDALLWYEALTGQIVRRTGFLAHDDLMAGASIDGHIGDLDEHAVIVEAKSPLAATHLDYLHSGKVPGDYLKQITHQLWITGARSCDWFSFQPDFPESLRCKLVRVERDEAAIAEYDRQARAFLAEVETELEALLTMADPQAVFRASVAAEMSA